MRAKTVNGPTPLRSSIKPDAVRALAGVFKCRSAVVTLIRVFIKSSFSRVGIAPRLQGALLDDMFTGFETSTQFTIASAAGLCANSFSATVLPLTEN